MEVRKEELMLFLEEIRELIENNANADGNCRFDALRVKIALDFTKTELKKSISNYIFPVD